MSDLGGEDEDPIVAPTEDVATAPSETADPTEIVRRNVPADILERFEVYSFRSAAVILGETHRAEFDEVLDALRSFSISPDLI